MGSGGGGRVLRQSSLRPERRPRRSFQPLRFSWSSWLTREMSQLAAASGSSGGATGASLPTADATGTSNLAASGGKIALVHDTTALACGAGITFVTFLCIIPVGLLWSRFEHISLRRISEESEHDAEELSTGAQA